MTGGSGFIGSSLAWALSSDNDVTVLDNLSTGRYENIARLVDSDKVKYVKGTICCADLMRRCLKGVEYVFHEAAIPSGLHFFVLHVSSKGRDVRDLVMLVGG